MAVPYQLPNGKTVMLSIDQILDMDDLSIQDLMAKNIGWDIDDPFTNLSYKEFDSKGYTTPEIDEYVEPLDEDSINEIKKQIDGTE